MLCLSTVSALVLVALTLFLRGQGKKADHRRYIVTYPSHRAQTRVARIATRIAYEYLNLSPELAQLAFDSPDQCQS